jgi:hypothetical protein
MKGSSSGFNPEFHPSHKDGSISIIGLTNNCMMRIGKISFFGI